MLEGVGQLATVDFQLPRQDEKIRSACEAHVPHRDHPLPPLQLGIVRHCRNDWLRAALPLALDGDLERLGKSVVRQTDLVRSTGGPAVQASSASSIAGIRTIEEGSNQFTVLLGADEPSPWRRWGGHRGEMGRAP
jgi:hypothetical protein